MSVLRPNGSKFYSFKFTYNGRVIQKSTHQCNRREAERLESLERTRLSLVAAGIKTNLRPLSASNRPTVADLLDNFGDDLKLRGKLSKQNQSLINRVKRDLGSRLADEFTADDYSRYIHRRQHPDNAQPSRKHPRPAKNATINRTREILRAAFHLAKIEPPELTKLDERNARKGFLETAQMITVLDHLPDDGLRDFVRWCYATGMRRGEAAALKWADVSDGTVTLAADDAKNGEGRSVPLVGQLAQIIERRRTARTIGSRFAVLVFHRGDDRPITEFRRSWRSAVKAAGCPGRIFHDLRRSAVRDMIRAHDPQKVAMEISGHKTISIFNRYNIVDERDKAEAITRTEQYRDEQRAKVVAINPGR